MSNLLRRLGVQHSVENESPNLTGLLAAHFQLRPAWNAGETDKDIVASVAEHIEECRILVVDDVGMTLQLYGTRRRFHRRSTIVCIRSHDDYAILRLHYSLHQTSLFFLCRSFRPVSPTRAALTCYAVAFSVGCLGSLLSSGILALRVSGFF